MSTLRGPAGRPVRSGPASTLTAIRAVSGSFAVTVAVAGGVAVWLDAADVVRDTDVPVALPFALAAFGVLCLVVSGRFRRPLDCSSDESLAETFVTAFILRVALAEAPALVAFAAVAVTGDATLYAIGLVPAVVGLVRTAPTEANLAGEQERLTLGGCPRSLVDALGRPKPTRSRGG